MTATATVVCECGATYTVAAWMRGADRCGSPSPSPGPWGWLRTLAGSPTTAEKPPLRWPSSPTGSR